MKKKREEVHDRHIATRRGAASPGEGSGNAFGWVCTMATVPAGILPRYVALIRFPSRGHFTSWSSPFASLTRNALCSLVE
ncbi:MAG TPA: hypothetical protein VMS98_00380 [Thermoanaerobaculia bacterium]|nr:hypothetical protein [Thermoanaerobaculia bacterium]